MNVKKFVVSFLLIINMLLLTSCGATNNDVMDSVNPKVTFEPVSNSFYYDQLEEKEIKVFESIMAQCNTHRGGVIELEEPISVRSFLRLCYTFNYDEEHQYWPLVTLYPYNAQNQEVQELAEGNVISKIYVQLAESEENNALEDFRFEHSKEKVLLNEKELLHILENNTMTEEYYNERSEEIAELEAQIIAEMPKDIRQKEAVFYFCNWIRENMQYDLDVFELCMSMESLEPYAHLRYSEVSFEQCIINRKALCGGFAIIAADLCNQVGIPAYVAIGVVDVNGQSENHGWLAVEIGEKTLYIDPTFVSGMGRMDSLAPKRDMERRRADGRQYTFTEVFEY